MKRVIVLISMVLAFILQAAAQVSHDFAPGDTEPAITATIAKDQVPAAVVSSVTRQFDKSNPLTWSRFPYALKEYGWVYDVGADNVSLDRYEVTMKTDKGNDLWAVYTSNGELVETREMSKNIAIPQDIMNQFLNSQYKDWKIVGNKEIIKFYHDHSLDKSKIEQHFRINIEKDGVKRAVSFNWKGSN